MRQPTQAGFDRTIELSPAAPGDAGGGRRPDAGGTIDSVGDIESAGHGARMPTEVLMTLDSTEGEAQVTRQLTEIWGDDVDKSKPLMTLKGKSPTTTGGRSTLVIQPRAFRAAEQDGVHLPLRTARTTT